MQQHHFRILLISFLSCYDRLKSKQLLENTRQFCQVRIHLSVLMATEKGEGGNFACDKCSYATSTKHHLRRHVGTVHDKIKNFACTLCTFRTSYGWRLRNHTKEVHDRIRDAACNYCEYKTTRVDVLKKHIKNHHEKITNIVEAGVGEEHKKLKANDCKDNFRRKAADTDKMEIQSKMASNQSCCPGNMEVDSSEDCKNLLVNVSLSNFNRNQTTQIDEMKIKLEVTPQPSSGSNERPQHSYAK